MPNLTPDELSGWEKIKELAGQDNGPSRAQASAMVAEKHAVAMSNLGNRVFSAQKHISQRLDNLNEELGRNSSSSKKLSKTMIWLTVALVVAAFVQAGATVVTAMVMKSS